MIELFKREPGRVVGLVMAVLAVAASFGLHLADPQMEAVKQLVTLLASLVGTVELSRAHTTPAGG